MTKSIIRNIFLLHAQTLKVYKFILYIYTIYREREGQERGRVNGGKRGWVKGGKRGWVKGGEGGRVVG